MPNYATILIEKSGLPSVKEGLQIGKYVLERKLSAYSNRLTQCEHAANMDTSTFLRLFEQGELDDRKDWIEWEHLATVVKLLQKKVRDLETLRYES
jgi:hypothetical protein